LQNILFPTPFIGSIFLGSPHNGQKTTSIKTPKKLVPAETDTIIGFSSKGAKRKTFNITID